MLKEGHESTRAPGGGAGAQNERRVDECVAGERNDTCLPGHAASAPSPHNATRAGSPSVGDYRELAGLLGSYALLIIGNGLFQTLIPLRLLHAGASTAVVGLIQSSYYGGFILGAVFCRTLIDRIGQHRTFVAFSAVATMLALSFGEFESSLTLAAIRLMTGFAFMALYASIESWLNGVARNEHRGRVFGVYAAINYLAVGTGQLLLTAGDASGHRQLVIVAGLFAAAVVPVTLLEGWPQRVAFDAPGRLPAPTWTNSFRSILSATPLAAPGCILAGCLYSTYYSMAPVFLTRSGFSVGELSSFMGVSLLCALIPQLPMGRISDSLDRRRVILYAALVSAALSILLALFAHARTVVWIATLSYVAVTFSQYALIVSHVNDRVDSAHRVSASAALLLLFSLGGLIGPIATSLLMTIAGPNGFFLFNGATCVALAFVASRALRRQE
ncbi:TPA: MFS transporter [Burkholderia vietnamiensis]|nr:MFS transporter [Burkholderia vietnamiensis]